MRPILMKGHERPLRFLKLNREGDLLFSCAKDHTPTVWFADNGERLGPTVDAMTPCGAGRLPSDCKAVECPDRNSTLLFQL
ncbi:hypothetical protein BHM03_00005455 [Ensete ventricosum]|nr:hypothetical protein BHM03_00005455 [Ensete ventricosum]